MMDSLHDGDARFGPGTRLGPYVIDGEIGSGGMGSVYRARDSRLDRYVALKVIRAADPGDSKRLRRFEVEARAAARVTHPNIVAVYDVGDENGTPYIVSELVNGGTLAETLRRGGLSAAKILSIATAVADGLAEAHRSGVVHRDLKPENILLTEAGTPKISDFGLSKFLDPPLAPTPDNTTAVAPMTVEGTILGTPAYMSPEQAAGGEADFRSDQFSFGVLLMEALTGVSPFRRPSSVQTLAAIMNDDADYAQLARVAPSSIVEIVRRCLAKEPKDRYGSTDDLVHDLRAATAPARPNAKRDWSIAAIAIVLATIATTAFLLSRHSRPAVSEAKIESLAILPLQNFSGDHSQDYFADGLTEEITSQLASLRALRVASRTSASAYRGTTKPLPDVARELGVDAIVEGSLVRSGDKARVTVQLIDGRTDRHLWSHSFDAEGPNVLALQRDIAGRIADRIRVTVSPSERTRIQELPTENAEAYDAYLHAKYNLRTALGGQADADAALQYAEKAVALDPGFAEGYVAVALACQAKMFGFNGGKEYDEKGFIAIEKALSIDPMLASAYDARGVLQYNRWHDYDLAAAVNDYRRAIAISPNMASAHAHAGSELTHLGRHDEAITEFHKAIELDPKDPGSKFRLARALWQSNRFAEALQTYERYDTAGFEKAVTLAYLGRRADAWPLVQDTSLNTPPYSGARRGSDNCSARALLYAMEGKRAEFEKEARRAAELGQTEAHFHHAAFIIAAAAAELGQAEDAVKWLEFSARHGMPNYPLFRDNPSMQKLHGKPAYERFMSDLRLRWEQISSQIK